MAKITLKGNAINTLGDLPREGELLTDFTMVQLDLSEKTLSSLGQVRKILNIFPSVDTATCASSVRKFNEKAASLKNTLVLNLSKDLPFAQKRFCGAEGIERAMTASVFRSDFSQKLKLEIVDGPLKGLCSRALLVLDENNRVLFSQQVPEIADEPNYEAAIKALGD